MTVAPTLIVNARLLDPASGLDELGGLFVQEGKIADFGAQLTASAVGTEAAIVDAEGACLVPGLVDMRVHFGEPGDEHKESYDSGSSAAVAGGVTSLALLPDNDPVVDDPAIVEFVARRARRAKGVKVYSYASATQGLEGRRISEYALLLEAGAVGFTDAERPIASSNVMRRALAYASQFGALMIHHAEDPTLAPNGVMNAGALATRLGLSGLPAAAEVIMIERDLRLVEMTGGRLHFARVSSAAALEVIRRGKARGLNISCDVTPHHLMLNELEVEGYRTFAKVRPPLRTEADRQALIEGLSDGTIDAIASDHRPQDQDSKRLPFAQAEFGAIGLETMLPVCLGLVHEGRLDLLRLLHFLTVGPATLLDLAAGRLTRGAAADVVLFDLEAPWKIKEERLSSLAKNTIFEGRLVQGRVRRTLVDGRTVFLAGGR